MLREGSGVLVLGIGIDIIEIHRVEKAMEKPKLLIRFILLENKNIYRPETTTQALLPDILLPRRQQLRLWVPVLEG